MNEAGNRKFVRRSIEALTATRGRIIDFGGGSRFGKWLAEYETLFKDCNYQTFDFDATTGADVIGDIHEIPMADASCDGIICASVLEHVKDPKKAMAELRRVLRKGGVLFFYVPSTYPYHIKKGHYLDYWRFFEPTLSEILFDGFSQVEIQKRGGYFLALSFFIPMQHRIRLVLDPLSYLLDVVFATHKRSTTAGYYVLAVK